MWKYVDNCSWIMDKRRRLGVKFICERIWPQSWRGSPLTSRKTLLEGSDNIGTSANIYTLKCFVVCFKSG